MRIHRVLTIGLTLALMGQGCLAPAARPVPSASPEPAPVPVETKTEATSTPQTPPPAVKTAPRPTTTVKAKTVVVEMKDDRFSPQIIAINAGDTVVWKNTGANNHTTRGIKNGPLVWDSGTLAPGQSYSRKFTAAGRFGYSCSLHAGMTGEVIVGEVQPSP